MVYLASICDEVTVFGVGEISKDVRVAEGDDHKIGKVVASDNSVTSPCAHGHSSLPLVKYK